LHQQDRKIVLVGGCFDILHFGHIKFLKSAKEKGDFLVVLLESDERIKQLKGSQRPLHNQLHRAEMLEELRSVDFVILLPQKMVNQDYEKIVKILQPAIIATTKGSSSLRFIKKQAKDNKAEVFISEAVPNLSTSKILNVLRSEP